MARRKIAILLGCVAFFFLFLSMSILYLPHQLAEDKKYEAAFRLIAAHVLDYRERNGRFPTSQELTGWIKAQEVNRTLVFLGIDNDACDGAKPEPGGFVLRSWRGEWEDCYAFPSGRTTLNLSRRSQIMLAIVPASFSLIAILLGWISWRLFRRQASRDRKSKFTQNGSLDSVRPN